MTRLNLTKNRKHRVKCDYGIKDYYAYYKKNGGKLDKKLFSKIIFSFNESLYPIICTPDYNYKIPGRLGVITTDKFKNYIKFEDGNLKTNLPPNWQATMKLWESDSKAKEDKVLVRYENKSTEKYTFKFRYKKGKVKFKNKNVYSISINRALKQYLKNLINNGEFDTSKIINYDRL